jgi:hypothetical protein
MSPVFNVNNSNSPSTSLSVQSEHVQRAVNQKLGLNLTPARITELLNDAPVAAFIMNVLLNSGSGDNYSFEKLSNNQLDELKNILKGESSKTFKQFQIEIATKNDGVSSHGVSSLKVSGTDVQKDWDAWVRNSVNVKEVNQTQSIQNLYSNTMIKSGGYMDYASFKGLPKETQDLVVNKLTDKLGLSDKGITADTITRSDFNQLIRAFQYETYTKQGYAIGSDDAVGINRFSDGLLGIKTYAALFNEDVQTIDGVNLSSILQACLVKEDFSGVYNLLPGQEQKFEITINGSKYQITAKLSEDNQFSLSGFPKGFDYLSDEFKKALLDGLSSSGILKDTSKEQLDSLEKFIDFYFSYVFLDKGDGQVNMSLPGREFMSEISKEYVDLKKYSPEYSNPVFLGKDGNRSISSYATGYYPTIKGVNSEAEHKMEGGSLDRFGKRLCTVDDFLKGNSSYISVAMDDGIPENNGRVHVRIPEYENLLIQRYVELTGDTSSEGIANIKAKLENGAFRIVDTGGAFMGKGYSKIDICCANKAFTNKVTGPVTVVFPDATRATESRASLAATSGSSTSPEGIFGDLSEKTEFNNTLNAILSFKDYGYKLSHHDDVSKVTDCYNFPHNVAKRENSKVLNEFYNYNKTHSSDEKNFSSFTDWYSKNIDAQALLPSVAGGPRKFQDIKSDLRNAGDGIYLTQLSSSHGAFIIVKNGNIYMNHASKQYGVIMLNEQQMDDYFARIPNKNNLRPILIQQG